MIAKLKVMRTIVSVLTTDKTRRGAKKIVAELWTMAGIDKERMLNKMSTISVAERERFIESQKPSFNDLINTLNEFKQYDPAFANLLIEEINLEFTAIFGRPVI